MISRAQEIDAMHLNYVTSGNNCHTVQCTVLMKGGLTLPSGPAGSNGSPPLDGLRSLEEIHMEIIGRHMSWNFKQCAVVLLASATLLCASVLYSLIAEHNRTLIVNNLVTVIVSGEGNSQSDLAAASDAVEAAGLEQEAISRTLPFLKNPGIANLRTRIYFATSVAHPEPRLVDALLKMAGDPSFKTSDRIDAAKIVLLLKPNPQKQREAEIAVKNASDSSID